MRPWLECPYGECRNPAQIFKKVTAQIKPDALKKIMDKVRRCILTPGPPQVDPRLTDAWLTPG